MKREIKFRAWMKPDKVMLSHEQLMSIPVTYHDVFEGNSKYPCMQFTGLLDKNGIEIYEGDIVDFGVTINIKEVVFDEESASFRIYEYLYEQGSALAEKWFLDDCEDIEVIGNIYENPELLEAQP